jgi:type I restriction enzyme, R subunit
VLAHFGSAVQVGLTATPLRDDNVDSYRYFGNPAYTYALGQGIEDGFLAPYRVYRVRTEWDAEGWHPSPGDLDRYGRAIPEGLYGTKEFERVVAMRARTEAVARHLSDYLRRTGRFRKTIVFCVDQEHAAEMRRALVNANADLVARHPNYCCRVTADEGERGIGHLERFQDVTTRTPTILTTSRLLSTGVDAPTCENVVLVRPVGSMTEFKQIIGRGTRLREDLRKVAFTILDYAGSATEHFADPAFDGFPVAVVEADINAEGAETAHVDVPTADGAEPVPFDPPPVAADPGPDPDPGEDAEGGDAGGGLPRKLYFDGGDVGIADERVFILGTNGRRLRPRAFTAYAGERLRTLYGDAEALRAAFADPDRRDDLTRALEREGLTLADLATALERPDADPFDLLLHLAFDAPLRTRRERADHLRRRRPDFFDRFGDDARAVLSDLLDTYAVLPDGNLLDLSGVVSVPPLSTHGNMIEVAAPFGGPAAFRAAVHDLHRLLYEPFA